MNNPNNLNPVPEESSDERPSLYSRVNDRFNASLDKIANRLHLDSESRKTLPITIGVIGGAALYLAAPEVAGHFIETAQSMGSNYLNNPGVGEVVGVAAAGGIGGLLVEKHAPSGVRNPIQ